MTTLLVECCYGGIISLDEVLHPFMFEMPCDTVEVNARLLQLEHDEFRLLQFGLNGIGVYPAMIGKSTQRRLGHGIDGVPPH